MSLRLLAVLCLVTLTLGSIISQGNFSDHPCNRECDSTPMTCHYEMTVETYASMSRACYYCPFNVTDCYRPHCVAVDGFSRMIYVVNRQVPSPQIRVCEGDMVEVHVTNHMTNGESTSFHWHGLHQKDTVYMDGVSMITQCPILPLNDYTYKFVANPAGTHWYHAHVGLQRGEGLAGALVVKAREDPHRPLYDHDLPEHTILFQDWFQFLASTKGVRHLHRKDNNRPDSLVINGISPEMVSWPEWSSDTPQPDTQLPYQVFTVQRGERYRFRVISNVVMNCPAEMYIEGHTLLAIASDGGEFKPVETDVVVVSGGERWDFVVSANASVPGNYWIYLRGLCDCSQRKTQTLAVLHYEGTGDTVPASTANTYDERPTDVRTVNPFSAGIVSPNDSDPHILLTELNSVASGPEWLKQEVDQHVFIHLGLHKNIDNPKFNVPEYYSWAMSGGGPVLAHINGVHGVLPSSPYLTQYDDIPKDSFCDYGSPAINYTYCSEHFCSCTHRVKLQLGEVVELIILDRGKHWNISNHPMHIHGQFLHVVAMGQEDSMVISTERIQQLDSEGKIHRNLDSPIEKDTLMIPDGGFIVTRFRAENPGLWFLHCHNELHVEQGMSIVLEVGEPDTWPQDPTKRYKCGPYREALHDNKKREEGIREPSGYAPLIRSDTVLVSLVAGLVVLLVR